MSTTYKRAYIAQLLVKKHGFNISIHTKGATVYKNRQSFSTGINKQAAIEAAIKRLDHAGAIDWNTLTITLPQYQ